MNISDKNIAHCYNLFSLSGNEALLRIFAGFTATALGYGGISRVAAVTGMSPKTISKGIHDASIENKKDITNILKAGRSRKPGGGRKPITVSQPGLLPA
jgi:hypothetical protein